MYPPRINTIAELQTEQERLKDNMRRTRQEFIKSAGRTTDSGQEFLLKKVLLPLGAVGLGVFAASKISEYAQARKGSAQKNQDAHAESKGNSSGWFSKLMLVTLPFLQQYLLSYQTEEHADTDDSYASSHAGAHPSDTHSVLSKMAPIIIPLLQAHFLQKSEKADEENEDAMEMNGSMAVRNNNKKEDSPVFESLYKLVPIVLPLVQQYFTKKHSSTEDQNGHNYARSGHYTEAVA